MTADDTPGIPDGYRRNAEAAGFAAEDIVAFQSRLVNSVYYREFTSEIAEEAIRRVKALKLDQIDTLDPVFANDLFSLPYILLSQTRSYREMDVRDGNPYTAEQEIDRVESLAWLIHKTLTLKTSGQDTAAIAWANPHTRQI